MRGGLHCSFCKAELPVLGLHCSWGACVCPPHSRAWAGTGSCSTAASRGNGLRNPWEANRCGSTGGFTPSCRRPPLPPRAVPQRLALSWLGLTGRGRVCRARRGHPEAGVKRAPRQPQPSHRAPLPAQPPSAGVRPFTVAPCAASHVAKPGPCGAGKAQLPRCISQRHTCPCPARLGR